MTVTSTWEPPALVSFEDVLKLDHEVTAVPYMALEMREDLFRIRALEMEWDIGVLVYEPKDAGQIPTGPGF